MKKFWRQVLPATEQIQNSQLKRILGKSLLRQELWHIQRDTIAMGAAAGIFWAFIPVPMQMVLAAFTAIVLRCNIPAGMAMCWITNPITIPFFIFINYRLGVLLTFSEPINIREFNSYQDILQSMGSLWLPLGVGSVVMAIAASFTGYILIKAAWRSAVMRKRSKRTKKQTREKHSQEQE